MRFGAIIAGILGTVALAGLSSEASAQSAGSRSRLPAVSLAEASNAQRNGPTQQRLRLNANGRWSLNFSSTPPANRDAQFGDVEAGAYYNLSPRLSVGAAAGLARPDIDPARPPETGRAQPRIRLESLFKF